MTEQTKNKGEKLGDEPEHGTAALDTGEVVRKWGPPLVHLLFSASKTVLVHDLGNRATQRVLCDLKMVLDEILAIEDRILISVSTEFLRINDVRVIVEPQNFSTFHYVIEEMKSRDVEAIEFRPDVLEDELGVFLKAFFGEIPEGRTFNDLLRELEDGGVQLVRIVQWVERERQLTDKRVEKKEQSISGQSNQVFFRTVLLMGEIMKGIEQRRAIQFQKAERLTQQMVDIIQADESILVGLASIKKLDEYTFTHSVNVCILSMLIADRLRLYKSDIARLGVAALLHDIGKTYIPPAILNNPGKLEGQDWELMKYHTFLGVKELSRVKAKREISDALFVALQHHVHYDMNGYPQRSGGWDLPLFTRIVTVADYYDAMTTPRVYSTEPLTPDKALRYILMKSGEIFDPFITKVFIQAMGIYPIGTTVELDNGDRAVVVRQHRRGHFLHRPLVRLLQPASEEGDPVVDLSEKSDDGAGYRRSVARAYFDPAGEQEKARCFMAE